MPFPNTRLSVVERTRSGDEETRRVAYAAIIEAYWKPAYKHLRVKWSLDPDGSIVGLIVGYATMKYQGNQHQPLSRHT